MTVDSSRAHAAAGGAPSRASALEAAAAPGSELRPSAGPLDPCPRQRPDRPAVARRPGSSGAGPPLGDDPASASRRTQTSRTWARAWRRAARGMGVQAAPHLREVAARQPCQADSTTTPTTGRTPLRASFRRSPTLRQRSWAVHLTGQAKDLHRRERPASFIVESLERRGSVHQIEFGARQSRMSRSRFYAHQEVGFSCVAEPVGGPRGALRWLERDPHVSRPTDREESMGVLEAMCNEETALSDTHSR